MSDIDRAIGDEAPGVERYTFADDLNLLADTLAEAEAAEAAALDGWCNDNRVSMDPDKRFGMEFQNNRQQPDGVEQSLPVHTRVLGVQLDSALTMEKHFDIQIAKGHKAVTKLLRLRRYLSSADLARLYRILVWPHLEYGMMGFQHASATQLARLDKVQARFVRVTGASGIPSLASRRFVGGMCFLYKHLVLRQGTPIVGNRLRPLLREPRQVRPTRRSVALHPFQLNTIRPTGDTFAVQDRLMSFLEKWNDLPASLFEVGPVWNSMQNVKRGVNALCY